MSTEDDPDATPPNPETRRLGLRLCLTLGVIGAVIGCCTFLPPLVQEVLKPFAAEQTSKNNLHQLQLAMHMYDGTNSRMPGPHFDGGGHQGIVIPENPTDRLSWRVMMIPYLESTSLYSQVNFSEAWNGPNNGPLLNTCWHTYADPLDGKTSFTPYRVFYDNGALWDSDPKKRVALKDIPDGSSNTILIAESTVQVPWAQFNEHAYDPTGPLPELGRASRNTFLVAMADGSVRAVKKSVSANTLRAAVTRAGGESLGADW